MYGLEHTVMTLRGIADRSANLIPVWPRVGDEIAQAMVRQFATGGAYLGQPWAPLDPDYVRWKVSHGGSPRILIDSGQMMRTFTGRPMSIERYRRQDADFGSTSDIAPFHQHGTRHMPARPIMVAAPPLTSRIRDHVARYIVEGVT